MFKKCFGFGSSGLSLWVSLKLQGKDVDDDDDNDDYGADNDAADDDDALVLRALSLA